MEGNADAIPVEIGLTMNCGIAGGLCWQRSGNTRKHVVFEGPIADCSQRSYVGGQDVGWRDNSIIQPPIANRRLGQDR